MRSWDCVIAFSISHTRGRCCFSSRSSMLNCFTGPKEQTCETRKWHWIKPSHIYFHEGEEEVLWKSTSVFVLEFAVMQLETKDPRRALIALYHSVKTHIRRWKRRAQVQPINRLTSVNAWTMVKFSYQAGGIKGLESGAFQEGCWLFHTRTGEDSLNYRNVGI